MSSGSSLPPSSQPPSSPARGLTDSSQSGDKRPRCDDNPEDDPLPNGRKKRKAPDQPWRTWGRTCARVVDAYTTPISMINAYLKSNMPNAALTDLQTRSLNSYTLLVAHIPALGEFVQECTPSEMTEMKKEMKLGQDSARQGDTHGLNGKIIDMIFHERSDRTAQGLSGLRSDTKMTRGFNNEETGRLLCPVNMDWADPAVKQKLRESPNKAATTAWPTFFYPTDAYDSEDSFKGLLRGELLVYAFKYIYTGPSSWTKVDGSSRTTRSGNAQLADMQAVTARSLAYVASQTRFALSSSETNQKVGGPFDLTQFFWHVVKFLEDPDFDEEVQDLLAWWNSRIFPSDHAASASADESTGMDSLVLLKAQKAAKRAALRNATNNVAPAL